MEFTRATERGTEMLGIHAALQKMFDSFKPGGESQVRWGPSSHAGGWW